MIGALAASALCGLPVERIVYGDALEAGLWLRIAETAVETRQSMMKAQAQHIAAEVSRLFKRS